MKKKLLSLALALVMCLSLTVPAFAAAKTLTGGQLNGDWGNGPSLTLTGVVGETATQFDPSYIYDVEVGGSLVLEMTYPAGRNRSYSIMNGGFYVPHNLKEPDWNDEKVMETMNEGWEIPESAKGGDFDASSGKTRFVYNFTESDVGQKNGLDKIIYPMIYWGDDVNNDGQVDDKEGDGSVYFGIRVHPASSAPAGSTGFTDVAANSPFAEAIQWAVEKDITKGTSATTFGPNQTCTVSHILTFLWRANGKPGAAAGTSDRSSAAAWAVKQDLIDDPNDIDDPCFRGQAVYFMWKVAGSPKADPSKLAFTDVNTSLPYASAGAWAVEKGVTSGTSATAFSPDKTCTRGQIVTFLYRADAK